MAHLRRHAEESRKLAEGKSCAITEERRRPRKVLKASEARRGLPGRTKAFEEAKKMKDGPERAKKWREAAAAYKVALRRCPARRGP